MRSDGLPRPEVLTLPFVLVPLAELAPELVHPVTGQKLAAYRPMLRPPSTAMILAR